MSDRHWRDKAACAGMDPALWGAGSEDTPSTSKQLLEGRQVCATRCPVMAECLRDAFKYEQANVLNMATVRGGLPADERAKLRRRPNNPTNQPLKLTEAEHARRGYVASRVRSDSQAAAQLGITRDAYRLWRERYYGGPKASPASRFLTPEVEALRMNSHAAGMSDAEIAIVCDASKWAIARWRKRRNLEPNIKASVSA